MKQPIVLHVGPDLHAGKMLKDVLEAQRASFDYRQYTCGPAAVARLFATHGILAQGHPTIIVLDMAVDGGKGLEFIVAIRSVLQLSRIPIVVIQHGQQSEDLLLAYQLGVSGVEPKPTNAIEWMAFADDLIRGLMQEREAGEFGLLQPIYERRNELAKNC